MAGALGAGLPAVSPAGAQVAAPRAISWLTIGDSYSSGHGVFDAAGDCKQSQKAFGPAAARMVAATPDWSVAPSAFAACTGHLVEDFYNGRRADAPGGLWQWAQEQGAPKDGRFDVVTMSFGGNDIGFADVITDCINIPTGWREFEVPVHPMLPASGALRDDCDVTEDELLRRLDALVSPDTSSACRTALPRRQSKRYECALHIDRGASESSFGSIVDFYERVADRHLTTGGQLFVMGYPKLFAESGQWGLAQGFRCYGVTRGDANMLGRVAVAMDRTLAEAVQAADDGRGRIQYISVLDAFAGRELCGPDEDHLNGYVVPEFHGSFHPNAKGHEAEAALLAAAVTCRQEDGGGRERRPWNLDAVRAQDVADSPAVREHDPSLGLYVLDTPVAIDHEDLCLGPRPAERPVVTAGHGTHVAGTAASVSGNGRGLTSPVGRQRVNSVDIFSTRVTPAFEQALRDAGVSVGADGAVSVAPQGRRIVLNGSFGYGFQGAPADAASLRAGFDSGRVLPVFAAGNLMAEFGPSRELHFPARFPFALAVGNTMRDGRRAPGSQHGAGLDISAPGTEVVSTFPWRVATCRETGARVDNGYATCSGTSMASPLVAGVAAALWKGEPRLHSHQVMKRVLASGGRPWDADFGYGIVDMHDAFALDRRVPTIETQPLPSDTGVAVRLRIVDDTDPHGLVPIDERYRLTDGTEGSYRLDFGQVPTSAVSRVRWSVDGGPWHDLDIGQGVQAYRQADGSLCQVCRDLTIGAGQLALTRHHKLVIRAWDSSAKVEGPRFAEHTIDLESPAIVERSVGSTTMLVVDRSDSMSEPAGAVTKLEAAQGAAVDVLRMVEQSAEAGGNHRVGLVSFATTAVVDAPPSTGTTDILARVSELSPGGATNVGHALEAALAAVGSGDEARSLLLLSDGLPTSGVDAEGILAGPVAAAKRAGVRIHAVAFGFPAQSDPALLQRIAAETGGQFGSATTPAELQTQLLVAEHATSGLVLFDSQVNEAVTFSVPRHAGSLRVTAITGSSTPASVVLTGPQGTRFVADSRASTYGGAGIAAVTVPSPPAGDWRLTTTQGVRLLASAQPRSALPDERLNPPIDEVAAAAPAVAVTKDGPRPYRAPRPRLLAAAAVSGGLGLLLLALGAVGGLAEGRRRRLRGRVDRQCPNCGERASRVDRFCSGCAFPMEARLKLTIVSGPDATKLLELAPGDVIGRGDDATHRLGDAVVSRRHARVEWHDGAWHLVDLGSVAGVLVDGVRATAAPLRAGAVVGLGNTTLHVEP